MHAAWVHVPRSAARVHGCKMCRAGARRVPAAPLLLCGAPSNVHVLRVEDGTAWPGSTAETCGATGARRHTGEPLRERSCNVRVHHRVCTL